MIKFFLHTNQPVVIAVGETVVMERFDGRWTIYRYDDEHRAGFLPRNWFVA